MSIPGWMILNMAASRESCLRSASRASPAPGYCTFTATVSVFGFPFLRAGGTFHTALCTCPMLAAAAGLSSNSANISRHPAPSCSAIALCTLATGIGGAASCNLVSACL